MRIDLSGSCALVTGASRGIGEAIARQLAQAGAQVAIHYFRSESKARQLAIELGNGSFAVGADLSSPIATRKLFKEVVAISGRVDILINNAAIALDSPIEDEGWLGDWDETMAVNLRAPAILSRLAIKHFRHHHIPGRIINIASRAAFKGDTPEYLAYAASKGGLITLSKSIARNCGKEGIVCFAIAPGFVRTDMAAPVINQYGEEFVTGDLALSELTTPEKVAPMVVFLASGMADHATGTNIDINAGSYLH
jgi:NAD(P)-dependent dehydrogenase (short-subunit alcohol dehydrogenase family)